MPHAGPAEAAAELLVAGLRRSVTRLSIFDHAQSRDPRHVTMRLTGLKDA